MIEGYIGRPGSGKTYTMTDRVLKSHKRYAAVVANYVIDVPNLILIRGPEHLLELQPPSNGGKVLVVLDEAHLWFPSRLSMKLPASLLMKLSQTRKAGWDMWWSAQHETRVDRVLKDVTNWLWLCNSWLGAWSPHPNGALLFTARCFEPEAFRKQGKHTCRSFRFFSKRVGQAYDTYEGLAVAGHVDAVKDFYRRPVAAVEGPRRRARG